MMSCNLKNKSLRSNSKCCTHHHNLVVVLRLEDLQLLVLEQLKVSFPVRIVLLSSINGR